LTRDINHSLAGSRFRAAMILAIIADALQIVVFSLFVEGADRPLMTFSIRYWRRAGYLLGWHWEFLPSFFAKLVPGVDLVLFGRWQLQTSIGSRSE